MPKNMFRQSLFLSVAVVCCIEGLTFDPRRCRQQQTCGQCQAVSPECSWCADENYSWNRCDRMDYQERSRCRRESVVNHTSTSTVRRGRPIGDRVLISPQYIQSNLYKGRPSTFTIRVKVTDKDLRRRRVGLRARTVQGTRVDIISDCPGYDGQATSCPRIRQGQTIEFRVTLTVNTCNGRQRLRLGAPGVRGRVVRADITSKCQCDCESQPSSDDPRCSNNGRFSCGVCQCYRGRFGERCECDADAGSEQCMASNSSLACSGRGDCVCGRCSCHTGSRSRQPYYGQFCECNDFSCNLHNRQLCGGAERGRCLCGRCMCNTGYRGQACEQSTDTSTCLARNQRICNNHGLCLGGVCRCDRPYAGPTCEDCPTCMGRCSELKNCVLCFAFSSGPLSREECHAQCSYIDINIVDVATPADASTNYCTFVDDSDGSFFFFNYWDEETTRVSVQRTKVFAGR